MLGDKKEMADVEMLKTICLNYIIALLCALRRSESGKKLSAAKDFQLLVLMSLCNTEPAHRILALKLAMTKAYKMKNFLYCAQFAKKIL